MKLLHDPEKEIWDSNHSKHIQIRMKYIFLENI